MAYFFHFAEIYIGKMNFEEMHNYHMAVTEREVINGCLSVTNVKDHVIIYTRIINNINLQNLKRASAFIDIQVTLDASS